MKFYVYSHNPHSEGAKQLSQALGIKRIKHGVSKFRGSQDKTVINWGAGTLPDQVAECNVLNRPEAIKNASNKLTAFELFKEAGVSIPEFFKTKEEAVEYVGSRRGNSVVCRTVLSGHSGVGIVMAGNAEEVVDARLYTAYIKKEQEYRYHVFAGRVVDIQRKARKADVPDDQVNWQVRNLDGGFIFAREGVVQNDEASENAIMAVAALGLDFGAVDLVYNAHQDKYFVLEVNTAPGLAGTTLFGYADRLGELM